MLDTVGGVFERAGRSGGESVALLAWFVVALKVLAAVLPLLALRRARRSKWKRLIWLLAWIEAVILTVYGLVLTTAGLLVQAAIIHASPDADHHALAWHAYLWDRGFSRGGSLLSSRWRGGRLGTAGP